MDMDIDMDIDLDLDVEDRMEDENVRCGSPCLEFSDGLGPRTERAWRDSVDIPNNPA